jgi:AraC family transcriptional regulator
MTDLAQPLAATDDPLERARLHIDAKLFGPLTLAELAGAAGLSAYHFSRQFSARFGDSPMAYVRALRLAAAAQRLSSDVSPSLIDLAFDCGFDSQEGFTRAFKRVFGVPPGRFRRTGAPPLPKETLLMSTTTTLRVDITQAPAPVRKGGLRIAGLSAVFDDANKAAIPLLWDRLAPRLPLDGQAGRESYGVCRAEPAVESGTIRYMAGVAIDADAPPPEGLEIVDLAPQTYLVFRQVMDGGALHPQMQAGVKEVWGERAPKSGYRLAQAPDLEFYPADFAPDRPGAWVEWWLPVEG